ncbi:ABC transporter ATP-binding protein [Saccharothrix sp. NRRL B-16348]|uniref:ABC transporter ATP-binding protein n=1 Tax=Saccharothrix sp. NRRL B-16348 TaxID=1415542 RepID=UPI0006ADDDCA|nr:ABC transporter ATP-binding protein [Saccharothrix sp. NRRL B-16348]KOX35116.1 ABC transporter ATP-binding protein [Saccharothrix sp. NRRL B-16348]
MDEGSAALAAAGLGKRYRRGWALKDCTFTLPAGRIAALVGPNGAGKSTLMSLATGLLRQTEGEVEVLGRPGFLAQGKPLYQGFTVAEMLHAGRTLNPDWDDDHARRLVDEARVPLTAKVRTLSGGQRTRVALAVALGRRPEVLLLDEPLADLDPLAREEVMGALLGEVAEAGMTVVLSSHVIADLDGICDHLLLLSEGRVRLAGDVEDLLAEHRLLIGPRSLDVPPDVVVERRDTGRQSTVLVRGLADPPDVEVVEPTLEELTLGYLRAGRAAAERRVAA